MLMVVMVASLGGLEALQFLLSKFPKDFPAAIAVVQHRAVDENSPLCHLLDIKSSLPVTEPLDGEPITTGKVFLAPSDYHLLIDGNHFALSTEGPVCFSRPSADVLFESAALGFGADVVAVVLTGSSDDGATGAQAIARAGGRIIVQDPRQARSPVGPLAAKARVPSAEVLRLEDMAPRIAEIAGV